VRAVAEERLTDDRVKDRASKQAAHVESEEIRVGCIEDDPADQELLARFINSDPGMRLHATWPDAEAAFPDIARDSPDVLLMDLELPGISGEVATSRLIALLPRLRILVVTAHDGDASICRAMTAGACGFLVKPVSARLLRKAIRIVHRDGVFLPPNVADAILRNLRGSRQSPLKKHKLSRRECDVLGLMTEGLSDKEIAQHLGIAFHTAKEYLKCAYRKLGVHSRVEALGKLKGAPPHDL